MRTGTNRMGHHSGAIRASATLGVVTSSAAGDGGLGRLGRWCAQHRAVVIVGWLLLMALATIGHRVSGGTYTDDFTLPDSPAQHGADLLTAHQPSAGGRGGQIVFQVEVGSVADHADLVRAAVATVAALPHVLSATDPLVPATTSADGRIAYSAVNFDVAPGSLGADYLAQIDAAVAPVRAAGVQVSYGGQLGVAARPKAADATSELIGVSVAILVLLLAFGSVLAMVLPIVSALVGVATGLGLLGMLASAVTFASVSPTLAVMMGLGVGIDYALFLTTRHRQLVMDGMDPVDAAARTTATSGRAALVAAATVVVAMLGLYASGLSFLGRLGLAASIVVAVAGAAAVTLVPALLALAGRRIDRLRIRTARRRTARGWRCGRMAPVRGQGRRASVALPGRRSRVARHPCGAGVLDATRPRRRRGGPGELHQPAGVRRDHRGFRAGRQRTVHRRGGRAVGAGR